KVLATASLAAAGLLRRWRRMAARQTRSESPCASRPDDHCGPPNRKPDPRPQFQRQPPRSKLESILSGFELIDAFLYSLFTSYIAAAVRLRFAARIDRMMSKNTLST